MKFLKTLIVFLALLTLTACAAAEAVYEPFEPGELTFTLPEGLAAEVTMQSGLVDIAIDSDKTDWATVAAQADQWEEISLYISAAFPEGAEKATGTGGFNKAWNNKGWSFEAMKPLYDECYEFLTEVQEPSEYAFTDRVIAQYSTSTNTIIPDAFDGEQVAYTMSVFFDADGNPMVAKYAAIRVTFTNDQAIKVQMSNVPVERIAASSLAQATVQPGSVAYTLPSGNTVSELKTRIVPPEGAKSYRMSGSADLEDNMAGNSELFVILSNIESDDYFNFRQVSFLWYDGEADADGEPTGNLVRTERLNVSVTVGEPLPWPNYVGEAEATKATTAYAVSKDGGSTSAAFAKVDVDPSIGTATVGRSGAAMPSEDMTQYKLITAITPPEGATHYTSTTWTSSQVYGASQAASSYDTYAGMLDGSDEDDIKTINGGFVVREENLFLATTYSADPGLKVYYDANTTTPYSGEVTFMDWYNGNGARIGRQWFVRQYKPMATTMTVPIITEPAAVDAPTLIADVAVEDYHLFVTSYPQSSESGTQIHYELKLVDSYGNTVPLDNLPSGSNVQLLIPYPDGASASDFVYTVNHYNDEGTALVESANTANATLKALDEGLLMTVSSLSPFVLSWETPPHEHTLTYAASGNTFTETCSSCDHKATWALELSDTCVSGSPVDAEIVKTGDWLGGEPTMRVLDAKGKQHDKTPTEPGTYTFELTLDDLVLKLTFDVITLKNLPTTGDSSQMTLWLLAAAVSMAGLALLSKKARRA